MKKLLLSATILFSSLTYAQETEVTVQLQPSYTNQVYYKFDTNTQTPVGVTTWDLAFQKASSLMDMGTIRINDGRTVTVREASANPADWANIDVAQAVSWPKLYNSYTTWDTGAFSTASQQTPPFGFGWGNYEMNNEHQVIGQVIFVLEYSATSFKKLFIESYNPNNNTYTFKYATWDSTASVWGPDQTATVTTTDNPSTDFTYFSFETNNDVTVAPADTDWDMVFRKYYGLSGETMYPLTGVLHNPLAVKVAQTDETGNGTPGTLPAEEDYSNEINTIGDDWKSFNGSAFVVNPERTYYVKYNNGAIYRLYFTSFVGTASGELKFNSEDVTPAAGLNDVTENVSFGVYPNPSNDGKVTLMYDLKNSGSDNNTVSIYSLTGAKVFETSITNNAGFYTKDLNLSNLSAGIYMLNLQAGNQVKTQKLVIK